jgi:hypothetical protein
VVIVPLRVLDTVTRTGLLGLRFWDGAGARAIADELDVRELSHGTRLRPGPSGVFVLHDLPGLHASATGSGDAAFWTSPPASVPLEIEVVDRAGRFLAFRFAAAAPAHGLFAEDFGGSPPEGPIGGVPLFSAPSRRIAGGLAAVRADLWDAGREAPAANAILEVSAPGLPARRGIADERGRVVVPFPYPEPPSALVSPIGGTGALSTRVWELAVGVRYSPVGSPPHAPSAAGSFDLCTVLTQAAATVLPESTQLRFGSELVLRTAGRPVLLVSSL